MTTCICLNCNKEFESKNFKKFCSQSCANKYRWKDPEYKVRISEKIRIGNSTPENKAKTSKRTRENWLNSEWAETTKKIFKEAQNNKETKEKKSKTMSELYSSDYYKDLFSKQSLEIWKDSEHRDNMSKSMIERWKDPIFRKDVSDKIRDYCKNPDVRHIRSEYFKKYRSKPEIKEKYSEMMKSLWLDDNYRKNKIEQVTQQWKDTDFRIFMEKLFKDPVFLQNLSNKSKLMWKNIDKRNKIIAAQTIAQNRPDVKNANKQRGIERWKDPEYAAKFIKICFKYKEYIFPSGKIIKVQGYEPIVIDNLLKFYDEVDFFVGTKNIHNEIGTISYYFENAFHTYIPDIYIKSIHQIIEVKSQWTYNLHLEKNLAKQKACLEQGFNFEFIIL